MLTLPKMFLRLEKVTEATDPASVDDPVNERLLREAPEATPLNVTAPRFPMLLDTDTPPSGAPAKLLTVTEPMAPFEA